MTTPFLTKSQRALGRRARERAQARAGSGRIPDSAWAPEIEHLFNLGFSNEQIAAAVSLSARRVREIRQFASEGGVVLVPDAKPYEELSPQAKRMVAFSADAFEEFFNTFSGWRLPAHAKSWVDAFCSSRNLILNVPPRHLKSSIFSLWVPVWLLCRDRNERILLVSKTKESAKKWVAGIAEQLTLNDALVEAFGRFKPLRSGDAAWRPLSGTLMVSGRADTAGVQYSVESRGALQQILGMEATVVVVDDITDRKIADSPEARESEYEWLTSEVFSRVETQTTESSGRLVVVGQRVSTHDVYGRLSKMTYERGPKAGEPLWTTIRQPAVLRWPDEDPDDPTPRVLWPEKWTFDELMLTYERVGGHATFMTMYQQEPVADGESVFRAEWWPGCYDTDRPGGVGVRETAAGDNRFLGVSRVLSIDPSVRRYHGLVVCDVLAAPDKFVCCVVEAKRWRGPQRSIVDEVFRVLRTYKPDYFVFEDVSFVQWLKEDPVYDDIQARVRVIPHQTNRNKGDPTMGVESLAREVEFGHLRLPYGDRWGREMTSLLVSEASAFPYGETTDILMALWFVKWNYRRFVPRTGLHPRMQWMPEAAARVWDGFAPGGRGRSRAATAAAAR